MGAVRADRLVAALLILQAKGRVTAKELAGELEVSERTARRDLEGLAMAGIPVYSQPGRHGGWALIGGARTDLSGLTAAEARTLFLVAGPAAATPEVRAALRKLVQALPATFRSGAQAAADAVVLDPSSWDQTQPRRPQHLDALQHAVIEGMQVELGYTRRDGQASQRTVHPLGLVMKHQVWYLVAQTDAGQRTFRVSRVQSVTMTQDPVRRPKGFDLAAAWRAIVTDVDAQRAPATVRVRAGADVIEVLRFMFGTRLRVLLPADVVDGDDRFEVELRGESELMVARQLAGFGDALEVVAPDAVREHLAAIGQALVRRHAPRRVRA